MNTVSPCPVRWAFIALLLGVAPPHPGSGSVARELENRARIASTSASACHIGGTIAGCAIPISSND